MLIYLFKSAACMAIFFVFYKFFLERENMHLFKRFYLLLALGCSIVIPALVFTEYVVVDHIPTTTIYQPTISDYDYIGVPTALEQDVLDIEPILWTVYFLGLSFFGFKFFRNLSQIIKRITKNPKQRTTRFIRVLLKENFQPHTFFNYIFLNQQKLESNQIPDEVLLHEETHAKQKHSWDVVFIELLQVIFWFNPLVYLFKDAIKLNHEFLADHAVLKKHIDQTTYQNTLLSYLSSESEKKYQPQLANAINYSSIKKRFTIMKTHTSKRAVLLRSLLLLPLLALLLLAFSETKLIEVSPSNIDEIYEKASPEELITFDTLAKKYNAIAIEKRKIPLADLKVLESVYRKMNADQKAIAEPFPECLPENIKEDATEEEVKEYNALAKKYNTMLSKNKSIQIKKVDVERLKYIYGLMSEKQKASAEPFPNFPKPPLPPKEPKAPRAKKIKESDIPNPSQTSNLDDLSYADKVIDEVIANQDPYDYGYYRIISTNGKIENFTSDPISPITFRIDTPPSPPSPPEPPSPLDHIIEMAKQNAIFKYKGKEISSDQAIDLIKNNEELSISTKKTNSGRPIVKISKYL